MTNWLINKTQKALLRVGTIKKHPLNHQSSDTYAPFFIMGSGRCGSTLLRKLIMANPQIVIPPESGGLLEKSVQFFSSNHYRSWEWLVDQLLDIWKRSPDFSYWGIHEKLAHNELYDLTEEYRSLESIIGYIYLTYLRSNKPEAKMWGDKTPYATFGLPFICQLYPNGRIIHMLRDGRDVVNSLLKHKRCRTVEEACSRWNLSLQMMSKQYAKMEVLTVRYEQLVTQPESVFRQISLFLNTELEYVEDAPSVNLGDGHLQHHRELRRDLHSQAIGRWRSEMSQDEIQEMLFLISHNLERFEYV